MEFDILLEISTQSNACIARVLEASLTVLATPRGRFTLFTIKVIGLIFDIYALYALGKEFVEAADQSFVAESNAESNAVSNGITWIMVIILFMYERVLVLFLIYNYGFHPTEKYDQTMTKDLKQIELVIKNGEEQSQTNDKSVQQSQTNDETVTATPSAESSGDFKDDSSCWDSITMCVYGRGSASDDNRVYVARSLWYGALWNTSDYIAHVYRQAPAKDGKDKCVKQWYSTSLAFLLCLSYVTFCSIGPQIPNIGTAPQTVVLTFLSVAAMQFGLFQHFIAYGEIWYFKYISLKAKGGVGQNESNLEEDCCDKCCDKYFRAKNIEAKNDPMYQKNRYRKYAKLMIVLLLIAVILIMPVCVLLLSLG